MSQKGLISSSRSQQEELLRLKQRQLLLLEEKSKLQATLPHIYMPHFKWSREFLESVNKVNLMSSANQIGKSVSAIRRAITNATDEEAWKRVFKGNRPSQIWYFYPDDATLNREFQTKWERDWLPRGPAKKHPIYGWEEIREKGKLKGILFNTGVPIYFFQYSQKPSAMQASTVDEIYCDEEPPVVFYDELILRLIQNDGTFNAIFTPTLGQDFWQETIETNRRLPTAWKRQISMYDCLYYEDGSKNPKMSLEKIKKVEEACSSEDEINRRVFGKFPKSKAGKTFYAFNSDKHMIPRHDITDWHIFSAVDYGSGGEKNHPSGIIFLAVNKDYTEGRVFLAWRGDGIETTASDLFEKFLWFKQTTKEHVVKVYDPSQKDFDTIASRAGESFLKATKKREEGEEIVNSLFRYDMLKIFEDELDYSLLKNDQEREGNQRSKLRGELNAVTNKLTRQQVSAKTGDDLVDPLRYVCLAVPWNWEAVQAKQKEGTKTTKIAKQKTEAEVIEDQIRLRRGESLDDEPEENEGWGELDDEFDEWNSEYEV